MAIAVVLCLLSVYSFIKNKQHSVIEKAQQEEVIQNYKVVSDAVATSKIAEVTGQYLQTQNFLKDAIGYSSAGSEVFCAYESYGAEEKMGAISEYLWVVCDEYALENGQLHRKTASSLPVALIIEQQESKYQVVSHKIPRDGVGHTKDLELIFPAYIYKSPNFPYNNSVYFGQLVAKLESKNLEAAKAHFNIL